MARVIEILKAHLIAEGFDGLVQVDPECGCLLDDLRPCCGDFGECEPAYRGVLLDGEHVDWAMYRTKEAARESCEASRLKTPNVGVTRRHVEANE